MDLHNYGKKSELKTRTDYAMHQLHKYINNTNTQLSHTDYTITTQTKYLHTCHGSQTSKDVYYIEATTGLPERGINENSVKGRKIRLGKSDKWDIAQHR